MTKTKKVRKYRKVNIMLEPDGFSIHTFELSMSLTKSEWKQCKHTLYEEQKRDTENYIYPDKQWEGQHICTRYADKGLRIRLEHIKVEEESKGYYIRIVVNPRNLIYPQSGYLGILPPNEESIELLEKAFHKVLKKSPFVENIDQYYLTRVDLCTNIRCENAIVFREMVRLLRKTANPKKYQRIYYKCKDKKKARKYNKHYIRIACDSQELVIYDNTYQMSQNQICIDYEKLPTGVLQIEVHYYRDKFKRVEKEYGSETPLEVLTTLIEESKKRICELVQKCYPKTQYLRYEDAAEKIKQSAFKQGTKERMLILQEQMQRKGTIDAALQWMKNQGMKSDDLLKKFEALGISPVPLRKAYAAARIPSLLEILQTVEHHPASVELTYWKWK